MTAGIVQILFGLFGVAFGIYLIDGHTRVIVMCSVLWLVSICCLVGGIKYIYESRRAA